LKRLSIGESVSVDGVCLTVARVAGKKISFQLLPETIRVSTLGDLKVGDPVNLERSLRIGDRLGGHLMLGHVDGRGRIRSRTKRGNSWTLEIEIPESIGSFLIPKGPIGVDGVSLTLDPSAPGATGAGPLLKDRIRVHLIPHTARVTTLGRKAVGSRVNLEVDPIAKYLRRML
jgi:riboflavin synthase alpha subunit